MCLLIPGSYSLSCVLPIIVGTVPYRRNLCTSAIYQMMPSGFNRQDAPPAYADLALDEPDDQVQVNYSPLYTYVSDYIPPPPYASVIIA